MGMLRDDHLQRRLNQRDRLIWREVEGFERNLRERADWVVRELKRENGRLEMQFARIELRESRKGEMRRWWLACVGRVLALELG